MKFILEKTNNKMVYVMVAFDAGARAETSRYTCGLAHMLEHMIFKGTGKRSYLDIPKEIAFLGADVNAFTSQEIVSYYIKVPYDNLESGMEILSDMVLNSTFPEEEFLKEREVVLEECLSYKDAVTAKLEDKFAEEFYTGRLSRPVIGTEESIASFTREELCNFYNEFYNSENAILCVSGDVEPERMRELAVKFFGPETEFVRKTQATPVNHAKSNSFTVQKSELEQSHVLISWPGLPVGSDLSPTLTILNNVFGSGMDSRLFTEVREKNNLCYGISMHTSSYLETGEATIYSSTRQENIEKMKEIIDAEVLKMKTELISEEELVRAKNKAKSRIYSISDSGHSLAQHKLMREFYGTLDLDDISKAIDRVTREDVLELSNKLFDDECKMTFVLIRGDE